MHRLWSSAGARLADLRLVRRRGAVGRGRPAGPPDRAPRGSRHPDPTWGPSTAAGDGGTGRGAGARRLACRATPHDVPAKQPVANQERRTTREGTGSCGVRPAVGPVTGASAVLGMQRNALRLSLRTRTGLIGRALLQPRCSRVAQHPADASRPVPPAGQTRRSASLRASLPSVTDLVPGVVNRVLGVVAEVSEVLADVVAEVAGLVGQVLAVAVAAKPPWRSPRLRDRRSSRRPLRPSSVCAAELAALDAP